VRRRLRVVGGGRRRRLIIDLLIGSCSAYVFGSMDEWVCLRMGMRAPLRLRLFFFSCMMMMIPMGLFSGGCFLSLLDFFLDPKE
jgi:hypothetical protein